MSEAIAAISCSVMTSGKHFSVRRSNLLLLVLHSGPLDEQSQKAAVLSSLHSREECIVSAKTASPLLSTT